MLGNATVGRAVTATLHVSPDGSGADGLTWRTAYQTIQDALDAASTDVNSLTLILIAPQTGDVHYDIDRTGDPTWAANVCLMGSHRNWVKIENCHDSATSVMKLTGRSCCQHLNYNLGTSNNGLIMTSGGARAYGLQFVGEDLTSAKTALHLYSATQEKHAKVVDVDFLGHISYMTGLKVENFAYCQFYEHRAHNCLKGTHILGANADLNLFWKADIGDCAIAYDIDAGNEQHFYETILHRNTVNFDDEVGDHIYSATIGEFSITTEPDGLNGTAMTTGAAGAWGADTELRAAVTSTVPFRIVGIILEPAREEWFQIRLSDDSGSTFFDNTLFYGRKEKGLGAPSGTEYIFNAGSRISASARSETLTQGLQVWLKIQEI